MALDANLQIATSVVIDISAGTSQSTTAFNIGKAGLVKQSWFVVDIEAVTADGTAPPFHFNLEYTNDNGSTWKRIAVITTDADVAKPYATPVGPIHDAAVNRTAASVDIRVTVTWDSGAGTDDVTFSAYIAGPQSFPPF